VNSNINNDLNETLTPRKAGQSSVNVPGANLDAFVGRMKVLVQHFGSIAEIARKCEIPDSTVKKWVDGVSDPSRTRCIQLAHGTNVSLAWLVSGTGPMWPDPLQQQASTATDADTAASQELRQEYLTLAIQAVEDALEARNATLPANKRAEAVMLVYELLGTGLPEAEIIPLTRRAIGLAQEGNYARPAGSRKGTGG
jgi:hypothetical protein